MGTASLVLNLLQNQEGEWQMRKAIRIATIRALERWSNDLRAEGNKLSCIVSAARNEQHADLHKLANQMGQPCEFLAWEKK